MALNLCIRKFSSNFMPQYNNLKWYKIVYSSYLALTLTLPFCLPAYMSHKRQATLRKSFYNVISQVRSY